MKIRKIPERTCVVTREKYPKSQLLRIVKNKENEVFVDLTGKKNGRGAYIKCDLETLEKARKSKILEKHLEIAIDESLYLEIENIIKNKN